MRPRAKVEAVVDFGYLRGTVFLRCFGRCEWCGKPLREDMHLHHRRLRGQGGTWDVWNIVGVHSHCHNVAPGSIHQEVALATERGFIVPAHADPLMTPILGGSGLPHYLTRDGRYAAAPDTT